MQYNTSPGFAREADLADELAGFRNEFLFPVHEGREVIYFCGNSLGLQPRNASTAIQTELDTWQKDAIGGYFGGTNPWLYYQDYVSEPLARMMGCYKDEVTVMNSLTVNLHLLMLSFYRPGPGRYKIIMEAGAFPSDQYAVETLAIHYGLRPDDVIVEVAPRAGEHILRTEDILQAIRDHGSSVAVVLFSGMNYYTGQFFEMEQITAAAHAAGAIAGFDLAHVAGNIPLQLHDWGVDFAVWCSYKYLNSGPGAAGGLFVHEKHARNESIPRLGGWWGNDEKTRFKMEKGFVPKPRASGWNISTAQVFNTVCLKASLEWFDKAGMDRLRAKSIALTGYLEYLLHQLPNLRFEIITPTDPRERGAQLSLFFRDKGREIHDKMIENGIIVDYREPGVIRVAPAPLYCSFSDVYSFYQILKENF